MQDFYYMTPVTAGSLFWLEIHFMVIGNPQQEESISGGFTLSVVTVYPLAILKISNIIKSKDNGI